MRKRKRKRKEELTKGAKAIAKIFGSNQQSFGKA